MDGRRCSSIASLFDAAGLEAPNSYTNVLAAIEKLRTRYEG